jgi:hypothetical protein
MQLTVADTVPGETYYTAPWGLFYDSAGRLYLSAAYAVSTQKSTVGTLTLEFKRTETGVIVNPATAETPINVRLVSQSRDLPAEWKKEETQP